MANYTPGQWRVDFNEYDSQWRVYQVGGPPIINALFHSGDEAKANAYLIAAAPDLLATAKRMVADLREQEATGLCSRMRLQQIIDLAAAIAKAVGLD